MDGIFKFVIILGVVLMVTVHFLLNEIIPNQKSLKQKEFITKIYDRSVGN